MIRSLSPFSPAGCERLSVSHSTSRAGRSRYLPSHGQSDLSKRILNWERPFLILLTATVLVVLTFMLFSSVCLYVREDLQT